MKKKIDLKNIHPSKVVYGYVYPVFAREFLFMNNYEQFANNVVSSHFILTPEQWEAVLQEWELKEKILTTN
jgi:hypothetical protein